MSGLSRFGRCVSVVFFVLIGVVLLDKVLSTAARAVQPGNDHLAPVDLIRSQGDKARFSVGIRSPVTDVVTNTTKVYLPYVEWSAINVCGEITVDTTWTAAGGPFKITCTVWVMPGVTLTIEAGTEVQFYAECYMFIQGELLAMGTAQAPIYFEPYNGTTPGSWGSVQFNSGSSGVLDYVILQYGGVYDRMLGINTDAVRVSNSIIQGSARGGIAIAGSPTIEASQILSNTGGGIGGLFILEGSPMIQNNVIMGNSSTVGGGIYSYGTPIIQNNIIISNTAVESGGGIYIAPDYLYAKTGVYINQAKIQNNIVIGNNAATGGGIFAGSVAPRLDYNDVWNNTGGDYGGITPGAHDISVDPLFMDQSIGGFHLAPDSAGIDAGDPVHQTVVDYEGDPRPMGLAPDIGLDEFRTFGIVKVSLPEEALPGAAVTYTLQVINRSPVTLTNLLLTDTLPVETAFTGYQADSFICGNNATFGGQFNCTDSGTGLAPGEARMVTVTVMLTDTLVLNQFLTNTVWVSASTGDGIIMAHDQDFIRVTWCRVLLNDIPINDLQSAIDASAQDTDVIKVSGYCEVNLSLNKTLTLQGGWRRDFTKWNAALYPTTLDGQGLGRVIWIAGGASTIEYFVITHGNLSQEWAGGGISIDVANPTIQNNIFITNNAGYGGGLSTGWGYGGNPVVRNNIFIDNYADYGGGISTKNLNASTIVNNIIIENTAIVAGGGIHGWGPGRFDYNNVWHNTTNYDGVITGTHDISADPMWVDPANGDYHLAADSPCIDTGDLYGYPPTDFEGDPRPQGAAPDIGIDEYTSALASRPYALPLMGGYSSPLPVVVLVISSASVVFYWKGKRWE
jgi:uncharacterized repeat protein (TIGR01451 family)